MNELEKKLKALQEKGFETVTIQDVLQWIRWIKQDQFQKRHKLNK